MQRHWEYGGICGLFNWNKTNYSLIEWRSYATLISFPFLLKVSLSLYFILYMTVIICRSIFFWCIVYTLQRCNTFKGKLFSASPNTWRTAAACSVLKGGLLSVTWQMYLPEQSWLMLLITSRWVPGLRIPDWGREIQLLTGGKVSTRFCELEHSIRRAEWGAGDYLSQPGDDAVAFRVVEIPLDGVNVLAWRHGVGASQDHLGPRLNNVCNMNRLSIIISTRPGVQQCQAQISNIM